MSFIIINAKKKNFLSLFEYIHEELLTKVKQKIYFFKKNISNIKIKLDYINKHSLKKAHLFTKNNNLKYFFI